MEVSLICYCQLIIRLISLLKVILQPPRHFTNNQGIPIHFCLLWTIRQEPKNISLPTIKNLQTPFQLNKTKHHPYLNQGMLDYLPQLNITGKNNQEVKIWVEQLYLGIKLKTLIGPTSSNNLKFLHDPLTKNLLETLQQAME